MTSQICSTSLEETIKLGFDLGSRLRGGEVIELVSDLGGGKTSFMRGVAEGMGSEDGVRSPSFTISNQYQSEKLTLHHFDFYRLHDAGIMREELSELLVDPQVVVAVEWGEIIEDMLPGSRVVISIMSTGDNSRDFNFSYPEELKYLIPERRS